MCGVGWGELNSAHVLSFFSLLAHATGASQPAVTGWKGVSAAANQGWE